jgi:hypothetical protein
MESPSPVPGGLLRAGLVDPVEAVEYLGDAVRRNSDTAVPHGNLGHRSVFFSCPGGAYQNLASRRRIFKSVVQKLGIVCFSITLEAGSGIALDDFKES